MFVSDSNKVKQLRKCSGLGRRCHQRMPFKEKVSPKRRRKVSNQNWHYSPRGLLRQSWAQTNLNLSLKKPSSLFEIGVPKNFPVPSFINTQGGVGGSATRSIGNLKISTRDLLKIKKRVIEEYPYFSKIYESVLITDMRKPDNPMYGNHRH